jgi:hypothetical protein
LLYTGYSNIVGKLRITHRCIMADRQQQKRCAICGSRFAERKCYFCESKVCTSCIVPTDMSGYTTKCVSCDRKKINRLGFLTLLKRNYYLMAIIIAFWLFTVFPLPFLQLAGIDINPSAFQPVLIATAIMTIPFVFMFLAWQKRAPRGSY